MVSKVPAQSITHCNANSSLITTQASLLLQVETHMVVQEVTRMAEMAIAEVATRTSMALAKVEREARAKTRYSSQSLSR